MPSERSMTIAGVGCPVCAATHADPCAECERVAAMLDSQNEELVYFYNLGYRSGHEDTVEACYTDILTEDMLNIHREEVNEIVDELRWGEG